MAATKPLRLAARHPAKLAAAGFLGTSDNAHGHGALLIRPAGLLQREPVQRKNVTRMNIEDLGKRST